MGQIGSQRAYGRHVGATHRTVGVWAAKGVIPLLADGRVDFDEADAALAVNGARTRLAGRRVHRGSRPSTNGTGRHGGSLVREQELLTRARRLEVEQRLRDTDCVPWHRVRAMLVEVADLATESLRRFPCRVAPSITANLVMGADPQGSDRWGMAQVEQALMREADLAVRNLQRRAGAFLAEHEPRAVGRKVGVEAGAA